MNQIDELAALFSHGRVAVLTGAGVSTDSGIPDYRGAGTPPRTPMSIDQFTRDLDYRRRFWAGARLGAGTMNALEPNPGHRALAALEAAGRVSGVMTQNVDGLHVRAGSRTVVELHGGGATIRCTGCEARWSRDEVLHWFDVGNPGYAEAHAGARINPDGDAEAGSATELAGLRVPQCPVCGGMLRPDVVYFGETVPKPVFAAASELVASAGALLLAGTSLAVNTGVRLLHRAERRGIPVGVINRGPTSADGRPAVAVRIDGGTSETLAALAEKLGA